ncbi:hypothetical protein MC885_015309 [Smutsia gigantea]|nr:hypothetical protein MC885_015309 [Smutsia gigantea]
MSRNPSLPEFPLPSELKKALPAGQGNSPSLCSFPQSPHLGHMGVAAAVPSPNQQLGPDVHCLQAGPLLEPEQEGVSTLAGSGEDDAPGAVRAPELPPQDLF